MRHPFAALARAVTAAVMAAVATTANAADASKPASTTPADGGRDANNLIYAEGLGPGVVYSLDYERAFGDLSVRAGAGYVAGNVKPSTPEGKSRTSTLLLSVPITVSYLGMNSDWSILEVGGGVVPLHVGPRVSTVYVKEETASRTTVIATGFIGYRYQPSTGGLLIRAGVSALAGKYGFLPFWPYVAAGGVF